MTTTRLNDRTTIRTILAGAMIALAAAAPLAAQRSFSQVVHFSVLGQSRAAVAPMAPMAVRESGATIAKGVMTLTTNESNQKIVASLDRPMPAGSSLSAAVRAPASARSAGRQLLGTQAASLVTRIPATVEATLPIEYEVAGSAMADSPAGAGAQRIVTYTIIAGS
ncbi:MAG: hypothetical protein ACHQRK_10055 [Gemmatimonadales bacterium]